MTVIAGSDGRQDNTQHAHHQHNGHPVATTSPRPAILSDLNRARSPSPTWTDDSAASSRIALNLSSDAQQQRETAAAGGLGFSRRLSGPSMPSAQSQGHSPTATELTHAAAHDLPTFIDLATEIAQTKAIANGSQAQTLLNHPPPRQGEFNYAVTLSNAAIRLSSALNRRSKHQSSHPLPGKLLMAHIHRLVMAQGSNIHASADDAQCLREAVKFLLVVSETQISVLRKSRSPHDTTANGSGNHDPTAMPARPRSPTTTAPLSSPKAKVLRALGSSGASTSNHSHSAAALPGAATGSLGSVVAGSLPPHSPSQQSHSLLFSDVASNPSTTQWNPFKRPSLPERIEPSSSSPLHEAQQMINQLLNERRLLQDEARGLARLQEESLRGEREKVVKLEGKLQQWKSAFQKLTGTESDDDEKSAERPTQEQHLTTTDTAPRRPETTSNAALSPLLQAPHSNSSDMLRPSFESFASSRQTDGGVSTSGFSYGSGSFSPAAASSGNNTPARALNGLPRLADVPGPANADAAGDEETEKDVTPRVQSVASGCTASATTRQAKDTPFSPTESSPCSQSPRSPSSEEEEEEVFADTAEQFDGDGEADLDSLRVKHIEGGSATKPVSDSLLFPQYSLVPDDAHRRPSDASTSIAPEDRRWSHASTSTNSMSQEDQLTPFDRRHSRASTNVTSPSLGPSHHSFIGAKGFSSPATGQRTRDRHSLPPQAPQPTSPLPDVPVGVVSGTCSPVQKPSLHGHAGPAWLMHRSASDDQGPREDRVATQSSFSGSAVHSGSGVIPLGLGFSHTLERSEDDLEGAFESAPSTLSKSTSAPLGVHSSTEPQVSSVATNDYAKVSRAPVSQDVPPPASTGPMPAAIAEEEGDTEKSSLQERADQHGSSASALQDFRDRVEADILLEPTARSNAGHSAKRGLKGLFKRDHNKQDSNAVAPSTPSSARSCDVQLATRPRGMTNSSLLSNGQSADTHATTTGSSGTSHDTTAFEGVVGAASAATSISDASSEQPGKGGRSASSRRSNGSQPVGLSRSTSSAAASVVSQQTNSSMSSEARQQKQQKRRELDLEALGITSPPIEHRSKYNRGSRSRILGHTSSLTNLKGTDGKRKQRVGSNIQQQPSKPQHPHSFMLSKDASLSTRYGAPASNRRRTNSSVSHNAGMVLDSHTNGRVPASERQPKRPNGGYGYVGDHQHEDAGEADAGEDEDGSEEENEGEEDEDEEEEEEEEEKEEEEEEEKGEGKETFQTRPGGYDPPKYPSIHASRKGSRPASVVSSTSLSSQSKPERSLPQPQEETQAAASRRLKFSRR